MVWDYAEIDPFQEASGSWDGAVRWIELAIEHCLTTGSTPASVSAVTLSTSVRR